ncbi:MAG: integral rane sensor signal transduction histidine kinase [Clostridia bacterium]|jgi:signal transduction histidine kinase|nr:integral rane sensor signal transduction histidine kinase [Clostridia bacterium]
MKLIDYLKDRIIEILMYLLLMTFVIVVLKIFDVNIFLIVYIPIFITIAAIIVLFHDYFRKSYFYNELISNLEILDKKFLIQEMIKKPDFLDGKILYEIIHESNKSMLENVNSYRYTQEEFREYIEMWVHEIKTPISSSKLIVENNKNDVTSNIDEELDKIDNYIEQVLYYSRSDNVEKDYTIKEIILEQVVNNVILKNKKDFIYKNILLDIKDLNINVNSDSKWLEYIINQIVTNSIKYSKQENAMVRIYATKNKENVQLFIEDNGIGIDKKDLSRVWNKSFTGENGRKKYNSTGMGLYLCKKLIEKLGHSIDIDSKLDKGTIIKITFPIGSFNKI